MKITDDMVTRFLTWKLPTSVYPDGQPGDPNRTGTNLLSAAEARQMLEHVLEDEPEPVAVLTDERIDKIWDAHQDAPQFDFRYLVTRAILAAAVPPGHVVVPASVKTLMEDFDNPCFGSKIHNDIPREIGLAVLAARQGATP